MTNEGEASMDDTSLSPDEMEFVPDRVEGITDDMVVRPTLTVRQVRRIDRALVFLGDVMEGLRRDDADSEPELELHAIRIALQSSVLLILPPVDES